MKNALKHAGQAVAGMLPAAILVQLGVSVLAAVVVFVAVLVLGAACWVVSSPDRSDRVIRMMLAMRGNARCLASASSASSVPASRPRRRSTGSGRDATRASGG
jgi:hypothetical protein